MQTRTDGRRHLGRCGAAMLGAAVAVALLTGPATAVHADTLSDLKSRAATAQSHQQNARQAVAQSRDGVASATQRLIDSQEKLRIAEAQLADIQIQLAAAKERDAQLAAELAIAQRELAAAKERVAQGEADVEAQLKVIVGAVTESYQQRSGLTGLAVVFDANSTADLSQRLQWNTTIFDTQAAHKAHLDAILIELQKLRDEAAALEARVASAKAEAAEVVARVAQLERAARDQRAAVADLVAANNAAKAGAEAELAADEAAYRQHADEEAQLQREIQAESARLRAEAAERERQAALAAERARQEQARAAAASAPSRKAQSAPSQNTNNTSRQSASSSGSSASSYGFIRPINAKPGSAFGLRFHPILNYWRNHNGNDWGAATGTPIYAAQAGKVLKAGPNGGFGNFVLIGHDKPINGKFVTTGYAHQSRVAVSVGQWVERGQVIGYVGNTGLSTTPHLHFEVRLDGAPVNPMLYLP